MQPGDVKFFVMGESPDQSAVAAWAHLVRAQQLLFDRIEGALKAAGLPPLRWYDVLLELHRAGSAGLRQYEIGEAVLLSKYNVSRLLDRLEKEGLLLRESCSSDGRGAQVTITLEGRRLIKRIWKVYGQALNTHFAACFSSAELKRLDDLLLKLPGVMR